MKPIRMLSAAVVALIFILSAGCTSGGGYSSDHSAGSTGNSGSNGTSNGMGGY